MNGLAWLYSSRLEWKSLRLGSMPLTGSQSSLDLKFSGEGAQYLPTTEFVCRAETLQGNVFPLSTLSPVVNCDSIREVFPISHYLPPCGMPSKRARRSDVFLVNSSPDVTIL